MKICLVSIWTHADECFGLQNQHQWIFSTVTGDVGVGKVILPAWLATCTHTHSHTGAHCSVRLLSAYMPVAMNQLKGEREIESQRELF